MVLDLGCGNNSPLQYVAIPFSVGVEIHKPYLDDSKRKGIHTEYILADITEIDLKNKSFDAVLLIDVLEHLTLEDGYKTIRKAEKWARKKVIILTPNGFLWQGELDNNPCQVHQSGWSSDILQGLGFKVFGMRGWRTLRGYKGRFRFRPAMFWMIISDISQKITYRHHNQAFQLLAIKQIGSDT